MRLSAMYVKTKRWKFTNRQITWFFVCAMVVYVVGVPFLLLTLNALNITAFVLYVAAAPVYVKSIVSVLVRLRPNWFRKGYSPWKRDQRRDV